jgi:threonylcarbamoyladenosine tRNA methylthiotransferase MtaB
MADYTYIKGMKATLRTLGCKLNFAETSAIEDQLRAAGVEIADNGDADICIVNTCSVTEMADHKCRQTIHKLVKENPRAFVAVMGCYVQLQPQKVSEIEGVDLVVGMENKGRILEYIAEGIARKRELQCGALHRSISGALRDIKTFVPSCSCGDRTRYFLKVQDGCDYFCTYCTIPYARGLSRSPSVESLVAQARDVASCGGKEIVITGVNIGDFGRKQGEDFFTLVKALDKVEGIERYRISSIEPNLLTQEIIEYCAGSRRFMPHFHIPLQSGSDTVLRLMHRRYDTAFFASKISEVHRAMPDAFIGIDVIVGTRGETPELFEETYRFLEQIDFAQLHVFPYSERPGTQALKIPYIVKADDKRERTQRLIALSERKRKAFYEKYVGTERKVLFEHTLHGGKMQGFTDNYIRVEIDAGNVPHLDNTLVNAKLGGFNAGQSALTSIISL